MKDNIRAGTEMSYLRCRLMLGARIATHMFLGICGGRTIVMLNLFRPNVGLVNCLLSLLSHLIGGTAPFALANQSGVPLNAFLRRRSSPNFQGVASVVGCVMETMSRMLGDSGMVGMEGLRERLRVCVAVVALVMSRLLCLSGRVVG